jgi:PPM family protein phosphatase
MSLWAFVSGFRGRFRFNPIYLAQSMSASTSIPTELEVAGLTHTGMVRPANEDTWATESFPIGRLIVVADGMGGHKAGEVASALAANGVVEALRELALKATPPEALARAFQRANLAVYQQASKRSESRGMGTTLTAAFIDGDAAIFAHVGDSRAYLIRGVRIEQVTRDHSWVAERVRQGILTADEAKTHRWRNVITNAIGSFPQLRLDLFGLELREGDTLLLCSDGVSNVLNEEEMLEMIAGAANQDLEKIAQTMIEASNAKGAPDNVTVVLARANKLTPRKRNYRLPVLGSDITSNANDPGEDTTNTMVIEPSGVSLPTPAWVPYAIAFGVVSAIIGVVLLVVR